MNQNPLTKGIEMALAPDYIYVANVRLPLEAYGAEVAIKAIMYGQELPTFRVIQRHPSFWRAGA